MDPSPLFLSNSFPTENRPGLHDQSLELVVAQLSRIIRDSDASVGEVTTWPPRIKDEVGRWLSDWHLVAFLCMQGLFSLVSIVSSGHLFTHYHIAGNGVVPNRSKRLTTKGEQQLLCRAATQHAHPKDKHAMDELLHSGGWQTLLTIAESSAASKLPSRQFAFSQSPHGSIGCILW